MAGAACGARRGCYGSMIVAPSEVEDGGGSDDRQSTIANSRRAGSGINEGLMDLFVDSTCLLTIENFDGFPKYTNHVCFGAPIVFLIMLWEIDLKLLKLGNKVAYELNDNMQVSIFVLIAN